MSFFLQKEAVIQKITTFRWLRGQIALITLVFLLITNGIFASPLLQENKIKEFKVTNVTLEECLKILEKSANVGFYYNAKELEGAPKVTVREKNIGLDKLLSQIFRNSGFEYTIKSGTVVIRKISSETPNRAVGSSRIVRGQIRSEEGASLPGAVVSVKSKSGIGAVADNSGNFELKIPEGITDKDVLTATFVGFQRVDFRIDGREFYTISLIPEQRQIEEVIVTGYQKLSKERSAGAVTVLKSEQLEDKISFDLKSSLEGKVAGLNSYKGAVSLRGVSSFSASTYPLVVVDGLPIEGTLDAVNPVDVESITVLKDAASASIYGSRAANGIIVVTTKSGKTGQTSIEFRADYSITPPVPMNDNSYASTGDIIDFERRSLEGDPNYVKDPLKYFQSMNDKLSFYTSLQNLYYQKLQGKLTAEQLEAQVELMKKNDYRKEYEQQVMRSSITQNYNLAMRKGSENMDVSFSTSYQKSRLGTINNDKDNVGLNFKSRIKLYRWLTINAGINCNINKSKSTTQQRSFSSEMPYERILDDKGNRVYTNTINPVNEDRLGSSSNLYSMRYNMLDEMESSFFRTNNNLIRTFIETDIKIIKGLSYNVKFQYQVENAENKTDYEASSYKMRGLYNRFAEFDAKANKWTYYLPKGGLLLANYNSNDNYTFRNQLSYDTDIIGGFKANIFAGTEFREFTRTWRTTSIYGYDEQVRQNGIPGINWAYIQNGVQGQLNPSKLSMTPENGSDYSINREFSMYANGSLSYQGKYVVTGSYRIDQANLFGVTENNKYRPLWSVGASWNVYNEAFMKSYSFIDMLKLRASYGINGNVDRSTSPLLVASYTTNTDTGADATVVSGAPNPFLRWEKTATFNVGLDFQLFKRKLIGAVDFYNRYTSDLMANAIVDPSSGYTTGRFNNGEMLNRGVELSVGYSWLDSKDFGVSTSFVYGYNYNEIKKVSINPANASDLILTPTNYYLQGDPFNAVYSYRYAGITSVGDPSVYDAMGKVIENNGVMKDPKAVVLQGQYTPKWNGSFTPSLRYKGLSLDALFVYYGGHMFRKNVTPLYESAIATMNKDIVNRWTPENPAATIPRFPAYVTSDRSNYWTYADINVENASFVKLRNLSLSYMLPQELIGRINVKSMKIRAQINDLWTVSACGDGVDPENPSVIGVHPTYVFGLSLTF